jgi:hypothetical protein
LPVLDVPPAEGQARYEIGFEAVEQSSGVPATTQFVLAYLIAPSPDGQPRPGGQNVRLSSPLPLVRVDTSSMASGFLRFEYVGDDVGVCSEAADVTFASGSGRRAPSIGAIWGAAGRAIAASSRAGRSLVEGYLYHGAMPEPLARILDAQEYLTVELQSQPPGARLMYRDRSTGRVTDTRASIRTSLLREISFQKDGYKPCDLVSLTLEPNEEPGLDGTIKCQLVPVDAP